MKAFLFALKKESVKNIVERLERHKSTLDLALVALSMYDAPPCPSAHSFSLVTRASKKLREQGMSALLRR